MGKSHHFQCMGMENRCSSFVRGRHRGVRSIAISGDTPRACRAIYSPKYFKAIWMPSSYIF